jgi:four helix bundle protein
MKASTQTLLPSGVRGLRAYRVARRAAFLCTVIAQRAERVPGDTKDQLVRAANAIPRNVAEGSGRVGRDRSHFFRIAYSSALEASDTLLALLEVGAAGTDAAIEAERELDEARKLTFGLIRKQGVSVRNSRGRGVLLQNARPRKHG